MLGTLRRAVLPVVVAVLLVAAGAAAQNLVANGDFAYDASGWDNLNPSTVSLVYHPDVGSTLAGGSGPGCLEVQHRAWNGGGNGPTQAIDVVPGATFEVGGAVFVPDSPDNVLQTAAIIVEWRTSDGTSLSYIWLLPSGDDRGQWLSIAQSLDAPSNATSAIVWLAVANPVLEDETRPGVALFDDIWVVEQGVTTAVQRLFVPAASSKSGSNNTFWTTDLWVVNETATEVALSGAALFPGADNSGAVAAPSFLASIPAYGSVNLTDVLGALGASITGALYLEASAPGEHLPATLVKVASRSSTPNPDGGGRYGQFVPVGGPGTVNRAVAPGAVQGSAYRTNAGALNTGADALQVSVTVFRADGNQAAGEVWTLEPYEPRLVGLPSLGVSTLDDGYVVFERISSGGSFFAYISVVDQATGDPILIVAH